MKMKNLSFITGKLMKGCDFFLQPSELTGLIPRKSRPWGRSREVRFGSGGAYYWW